MNLLTPSDVKVTARKRGDNERGHRQTDQVDVIEASFEREGERERGRPQEVGTCAFAWGLSNLGGKYHHPGTVHCPSLSCRDVSCLSISTAWEEIEIKVMEGERNYLTHERAHLLFIHSFIQHK